MWQDVRSSVKHRFALLQPVFAAVGWPCLVRAWQGGWLGCSPSVARSSDRAAPASKSRTAFSRSLGRGGFAPCGRLVASLGTRIAAACLWPPRHGQAIVESAFANRASLRDRLTVPHTLLGSGAGRQTRNRRAVPALPATCLSPERQAELGTVPWLSLTSEDSADIQTMDAQTAMITNGDIARQVDEAPPGSNVECVETYEDEKKRMRVRLVWA